MAKVTVFVASPNATARTPVAMGSSVLVWPAFRASNIRLTTLTTSVDVIPPGLSTTTQPWTKLPFGLPIAAFFRVLRFEVALDARRLQNRLDLLGLSEGFVLDESQIRRELERDHPAHQTADEAAVTIERVDDLARIPAAQRLAEDHGMPHVRRGFDLGHRHGDPIKIRIAHVAPRKNLGNRVAQQFANTQLAV